MKKFMKKLAKKAEGFTLVELVVVIAILGILAGVGIAGYSGYITKAQEAGDITALSAIKTAAVASQAEAGTVEKMTLTITTATGTITDIKAVVDNNGTDTTVDLDADTDFMMYLNNAIPGPLKSKTYNKATLVWTPDNWA